MIVFVYITKTQKKDEYKNQIITLKKIVIIIAFKVNFLKNFF